MMPSVPTPGNHEYARDAKQPLARRQLSGHWRPQFTLPENGPEGLVETVYWLDYQGTRIVSLNSNEEEARQVDWLDRLLADNPHKWTIVTFHHPIYSTARGRDNPTIRRLWKPLFDKHRVDLVLQGHDHSYGRFGQELTENVPTGASARSPEGGTVYVVSVSGPKMYAIDREPSMRRAAEDTQLYQIISIDGERLRYEARTATGELYDAFSLHKRAGQTNELVDEIPNTPERRRAAKEVK
jgi:3',5'-cyclic AMP phosphodiesterase CpdA